MVEDKDRALIKDVMKRGKAQLRERQVPWASVQRWHQRLEALEGDVQQLLQVRRHQAPAQLTVV